MGKLTEILNKTTTRFVIGTYLPFTLNISKCFFCYYSYFIIPFILLVELSFLVYDDSVRFLATADWCKHVL